jgi:hypothetical protein
MKTKNEVKNSKGRGVGWPMAESWLLIAESSLRKQSENVYENKGQ